VRVKVLLYRMAEKKHSLLRGMTRCSLMLTIVWGAALQLLPAQEQAEQIVSSGASPAYGVRHKYLHSLSPGDLATHADELFQFMAAGQVPEGMEVDAYLSLSNDIFDLLLKEGAAVPQLLEYVLQTIPDHAANRVWRDYCVQKLAPLLLKEGLDNESVAEAMQLLDELTNGSIPEMQGTAFIVAYSLSGHDLAKEYSILSEGAIGQRAVACARNEKSALIDRVTALTLAARCRNREALSVSESILNQPDGGIEPMLKVSAIATIGLLGDAHHLESLQRFRLSPDIRFKNAARVAIERIKARG